MTASERIFFVQSDPAIAVCRLLYCRFIPFMRRIYRKENDFFFIQKRKIKHSIVTISFYFEEETKITPFIAVILCTTGVNLLVPL